VPLHRNCAVTQKRRDIRAVFKVTIVNRHSHAVYQQEVQLMLRNPRDRMFYANRVSAYIVPFSR